MSFPPSPQDTIAALSSAPGCAARALLRVSGPAARSVLEALLAGPTPTAAGRVVRTHARLADGGSLPVEAVWMAAGRSYTGQEMAELHLPGAAPVAAALLAAALAAGARAAGPGEFTLRAFLAGRLDLVQAEAVAGLIEAHDRRELAAALRALAGELSRPLKQLERRLLELCAEVEAAIDFADQDLPLLDAGRAAGEVAEARAILEALLAAVETRRPVRERPRVLLLGPPNAGKTTLYNALTGTTEAITSARPGTTRDLLAAPCDVDGRQVELVDAPGLADYDGGADQRAVERAWDRVGSADLVLWVTAADRPGEGRSWIRRLSPSAPRLRVLNKCDLAGDDSTGGGALRVSALRGDGLDRLRVRIRRRLEGGAGASGGLTVSARQREALRAAESALARAGGGLAGGAAHEIVAADLREALGALGALTGRDVTEEVLGRIFERFCIGK